MRSDVFSHYIVSSSSSLLQFGTLGCPGFTFCFVTEVLPPQKKKVNTTILAFVFPSLGRR